MTHIHLRHFIPAEERILVSLPGRSQQRHRREGVSVGEGGGGGGGGRGMRLGEEVQREMR